MPKFYAEIWRPGPIFNEVRRLARLELRKRYGADKWDAMTEKQQANHVVVLLWNSEDVFLKRAKFNLEERK